MVKRVLQVVALCLFVVSAWGLPTERDHHSSQPRWTFTVGPGTVVAVHALDVAFVGRCYIVKYQTERGEIIEIRDLQHKGTPVLEGMHGLLTYSTNPEMILNFQVVEPKSAK